MKDFPIDRTGLTRLHRFIGSRVHQLSQSKTRWPQWQGWKWKGMHNHQFSRRRNIHRCQMRNFVRPIRSMKNYYWLNQRAMNLSSSFHWIESNRLLRRFFLSLDLKFIRINEEEEWLCSSDHRSNMFNKPFDSMPVQQCERSMSMHCIRNQSRRNTIVPFERTSMIQ